MQTRCYQPAAGLPPPSSESSRKWAELLNVMLCMPQSMQSAAPQPDLFEDLWMLLQGALVSCGDHAIHTST